MVSRPTACDRVRLGELLEARLSDFEQAELSGHLERCEVCRRELEAMAAESQWWHDVRKLADTDAFGSAEAAAALGHDEPSLAFLAPSDDPEHLGRLGPYEVTSIIGRGGMSIVLKAFDPGLSRVVAIKVLAPQLATSAAARRRFAREARAAAAVSHDHVVPIHAVDSANGFPYLVMPFLPGRSLQDRLDRDGPLEVEEILRIGMQTAAGLAAAHQQGLVHRDIKPANILLEHGVERVKITDFGLARAIDDASATQSGVVAGTPQYMAPEQTRGGSIDHRADLFSLGSVMYAMATGHSPFRAETTMAVLRRVSDVQPRPIQDINPQIPEWLAAIVAKLHEKEPEDRFQTAAEVADLLGRCLAFVQQPSVAALPRVPRLRRSDTRVAHWGVAAIAIVLVAGLGATEVTGITGLLNSVTGVFPTDSHTRDPWQPRPDSHSGAAPTGTTSALDGADNRELDLVSSDSAEAQGLAMTAADGGPRYALSLVHKPGATSSDSAETPEELEADRPMHDLIAVASHDRAPRDDSPDIPDRPQTRAIAVRAQIEALRFEINAYQQVLNDAEKAGVVAALRNRLERLEKQLVEIAGTALDQPPIRADELSPTGATSPEPALPVHPHPNHPPGPGLPSNPPSSGHANPDELVFITREAAGM